MGTELGRLEQEMGKYSGSYASLAARPCTESRTKSTDKLVLNLLDRADNPCRLVGESYDEETAPSPLRLQANDVNTVCFIFSSKLILCYLFHEYHQAIEHAAVAEKYLASLVGTAAIPGFHLYDSLARLAVFAEAGESEQKDILEKVTANQAKMQLWARHAPMNHAHKFYLVEAERARVTGHDRDAREYYDQAIDLAREHGYVNEEALANEVAARFYLARGQDTHCATLSA